MFFFLQYEGFVWYTQFEMVVKKFVSYDDMFRRTYVLKMSSLVPKTISKQLTSHEKFIDICGMRI